MTDLTNLCPKGEAVWVTYYNRENDLMIFLTGPDNLTFTLTAQTGAFTLYEVTVSPRGLLKAKKLGRGGNPTELEMKYGVREKMKLPVEQKRSA